MCLFNFSICILATPSLIEAWGSYRQNNAYACMRVPVVGLLACMAGGVMALRVGADGGLCSGLSRGTQKLCVCGLLPSVALLRKRIKPSGL